ncbi:hypothetical protein, partial [Aeromicrobium tamlense]|uniref:hypothetical protein n=1 Tax=Aeromicrobium tamlense TaxID=375541 RepID=UPI0031D18CE9
MQSFQSLPFETRLSDEHGYDLFEELVWHSSEVCNSCFSQVRSVGPEHSKQLEEPPEKCLEDGDPVYMTINEWYERTENGAQEHTTWDHNERFGTCYCLECGTDCTGNHRNKSLQELKPLAKNIYRYVTRETEHDLDAKRFGAEVRELKQRRSAQGNETEVLGIAFARALER